eukprot:4857810-Karenia_brevis.AAC.1
MLTKIAMTWHLVVKLVEMAKILKNQQFFHAFGLLGSSTVTQTLIEVGMSTFNDFLSMLERFWDHFGSQLGTMLE